LLPPPCGQVFPKIWDLEPLPVTADAPKQLTVNKKEATTTTSTKQTNKQQKKQLKTWTFKGVPIEP